MAKKPARPKAAKTLEVEAKDGEDPLKTLARIGLNPAVRHASVSGDSSAAIFGKKHAPTIMDHTEVLAELMKSAAKGDKQFQSQYLAAQAVTLDTLFTELASRSRQNMGQYFDAAERYMRLALKAQANSRATLEALTKLHQPREQTVKHVHVNEGGQAVVADQFHQHTGGRENGKTDEQSHTTGTAGESPSMLGEDPQGNGVPIPGSKRAKAVQDARRDQSGRA
jgi:hypothetical protein